MEKRSDAWPGGYDHLPRWGAKFIGVFKEGEPAARGGTYIFPDGARYEGEVKGGIPPHGRGVTVYPDGTKLAGHYVDGEPSVQGKYTYPPMGVVMRASWMRGCLTAKEHLYSPIG